MSRVELQEISQLIGLDPSTLEQALCSRTVKVRDESVLTALSVSQVSRDVTPTPSPPRWAHTPGPPVSPLPSPQGYYGRDALAKNIYSRLFDWLVNRINTSIQVSPQVTPQPCADPPPPTRMWLSLSVPQVKPGKQRKVMGVLDIYGFEIFQVRGSRRGVGWGLQEGCWGGSLTPVCHSGGLSHRTTASSSSSSTTATRSCSRSSS